MYGRQKRCIQVFDGEKMRIEKMRPLRRPRHRWEENIKMDLQRSGIQKQRLDLSGSGWGQVVGACKCGNEPQSSIKCDEFLNYLRTVSFSERTLQHEVIELVCQLVNNHRLPLQTTNIPAHIMINTNGSVWHDWNVTKYVKYFAIYAQRGKVYFVTNLSR